MASLYLDHNVSNDLSPLLERSGHGVITVRGVRGERLPDDALLLSTVQRNRIFVTHDRKDFKMLHDAWLTWPAAFGLALPPHSGILVLDPAPPETLARVLNELLAATPAERLRTRLLRWHHRDGWRLPGAGAGWEPYQPAGETAQE